MYTFEDKKSEDILKELIQRYEDFKEDDASSQKAVELAIYSWHLIDWVFNEFKEIHHKNTIGDFRDALYPECESLKIMHDIANGAKHSRVSRPKASIKKTKKHIGAFSSVFSREFDQTHLLIEIDNGKTLYFVDEIDLVINFWKNYFKNELKRDL